MAGDDDFADFADYATPAAASSATASPLSFAAPTAPPNAWNGPWYAIWERHALSEFKIEGYVFLLLIFVIGAHLIGSRRNRSLAKSFITALSPVLTAEFAQVGFTKDSPIADNVPFNKPFDVERAVRENTNLEFVSYATGRNNIAFMHTTIKLACRNNPVGWFGQYLASFMIDAIPPPADTVTISMSPFDGTSHPGAGNTKYDNFIWALVHKRNMRRWREDRYDLSLTRTSDWEGLPGWCAVMGESKEVGDLCLTPELKDVIKDCEPFFEYLIISDMPKEKPTKLDEFTPRKRLTLQLTLPSSSTSPETLQKLLQSFIRLLDHLVAKAHFRPEVLRKIKLTREEETRKLKKQLDEETKEERELKRAEEKKEERDRKLRGMSATEQKKFLEKEREKERKGLTKKGARKA